MANLLGCNDISTSCYAKKILKGFPLLSIERHYYVKKMHRTAATDFILHTTRSAVLAHGKNHEN